ncbi:B2 protein-like [Diabrotica virgifera virgifera]|uniref:B2 protein-like n=1 Tax=Diabrotica virgifera virgifera TaxID=50390 RepID=A0A6P7FQD3_DIAVI|nr:B2 protein-like [Diabrotica virgifera virgifera]
MFYSIFLLIFCIFEVSSVHATVLSPEVQATILSIGKKCVEETGVDVSKLIEIREGNFVEDPKVKEHLLCMSKTSGAQKENGDFDEGKIRKTLIDISKDPAKTDEVIKKCMIKKPLPEDSIFESCKCLYGEIPKEEILALKE